MDVDTSKYVVNVTSYIEYGSERYGKLVDAKFVFASPENELSVTCRFNGNNLVQLCLYGATLYVQSNPVDSLSVIKEVL